MRPPFVDAAREVGSLVESFDEAVVRGSARPLIDDNDEHMELAINLGLDADAEYFLSVAQARDSGTLWVRIQQSDGRIVDAWTEHELGVERVRRLWTSCRAQLYSSDLEEAVSELSAWVRKHHARG